MFKKAILFITIFLIAAKIALAAGIFLYPKIIREETIGVSSEKLIELTNEYRVSQGLKPLTVNYRLTQAAVNHARDIFAKQYFSHTSPDGTKFSDWIKEVNYPYFYVGENLAIDFTDSQAVFDAWLASPTHRENILKSQYREIGIAALSGKFDNRSSIVVVQLFGTRSPSENESAAADEAAEFATTSATSETTIWDKVPLSLLETVNRDNDCALIIFVGLCLIFYTPRPKINHINVKQPIISRYHAKMFRE